MKDLDQFIAMNFWLKLYHAFPYFNYELRTAFPAARPLSRFKLISIQMTAPLILLYCYAFWLTTPLAHSPGHHLPRRLAKTNSPGLMTYSLPLSGNTGSALMHLTTTPRSLPNYAEANENDPWITHDTLIPLWPTKMAITWPMTAA